MRHQTLFFSGKKTSFDQPDEMTYIAFKENFFRFQIELNWQAGVQNCPNQRTTLLLKISFSQKTVCHQKTWSRQSSINKGENIFFKFFKQLANFYQNWFPILMFGCQGKVFLWILLNKYFKYKGIVNMIYALFIANNL